MKDLSSMNIDDLVLIIKSHKNELQGKNETRLEEIASIIKDSGEKLHPYFSKLLLELSKHLTDLQTIDFPSVLLFIEKTGIKGNEIVWDYLKQIVHEKSVERKTLLLKISYKLDPVFISKDFLYRFQDIRTAYPIFWCDLMFTSDHNEAIKELGITIKENNISFSSFYPVVNRWLRKVKSEDTSESFINSLYDLKTYLKPKDNDLFLQWLNENDINTNKNEYILEYVSVVNQSKYVYANV